MLRTENHIEIVAPADLVYHLAADVGNWPDMLPHYRYVTLFNDPAARSETSRRIKMGARRGRIPVRWTAWQSLEPSSRTIKYHHTGGFTTGMDVEWRIEARDGGRVRATIVHVMRSPSPWLRSRIAEYIIGHLFVEHIADQTLRQIKAQAETQTATGTTV